MTHDWTRSATARALGIGFLAVLMMIPLFQVQDLVRERRGLEFEARTKIAERWGGEQQVAGPVLVVPVRRLARNGNETVEYDERHVLLPERLQIEGVLETERRSYGIYETPVYTAGLRVSGHFDPAAIHAALAVAGGEPQWKAAVLRVPVSDVRGIRQVSALRVDGRELAFGPGSPLAGIAATEAAWPLDGALPERAIGFSFELRLAGTATLHVLPLARQTDVELSSVWPDPSFSGAFLPATRETGAQGFSARWQVLDLNRAFAQSWKEDGRETPALAAAAFGVELYQPVDTWQRNERAGKYGVLFIALTFVALFLFDALGRWRVHPVQYLLVGLALCTFYVVLLALSEQVGFGIAYFLAATAVVVIIGGYARAAARSGTAGATLGGLLVIVYALLYGLVISEQYSLLMGAVALLASVAVLMYLTRRVDWYALGPARIDVPAGMGPR